MTFVYTSFRFLSRSPSVALAHDMPVHIPFDLDVIYLLKSEGFNVHSKIRKMQKYSSLALWNPMYSDPKRRHIYASSNLNPMCQ
jgi:hypothetical protein